jgi:hypothetical protein
MRKLVAAPARLRAAVDVRLAELGGAGEVTGLFILPPTWPRRRTG